MSCPECGSVSKVKNGFVHGMQRHRCKDCGCNYTKSTPRGYPLSIKKRAIQFYLEGLGFRSISRLLGVSHVSLQRWVKDMAGQIQSLKASQEIGVKHATLMEIDEMWHYVGKKTEQSGSGWLLIEIPEMSLASGSVLVVEKR